MTNIFIANLDWEITSEDLMATFSSFGTVGYAHVVFDNATKRSKGFGYVEMETTDAAILAIQALHGMEINGRTLDVKIASPKSNRPPKKEPVEKPPFKRTPTKNFSSNSGEKKPYNRDRTPGERKPYNNNRPQGERKPYNADRPTYRKKDTE